MPGCASLERGVVSLVADKQARHVFVRGKWNEGEIRAFLLNLH
jgi:hypothetical protein